MIRLSRYLPVDSDSSEDNTSHSTRMHGSRVGSTSSRSGKSKKYNIRKSRHRISYVPSDESSSSDGEIVRSPRHGSMRALSDYDSCDSEEESITSQRSRVIGNEIDSSSSDSTIQIRSRKRSMRLDSLSSTDSSDSGVPLRFQKRIKRIKYCPTSGESSNSDGDSEIIKVIRGSGTRPNTLRRINNAVRIDRSKRENNFGSTIINVALNRSLTMSVGNTDDDENWFVNISPMSSDSETSSDNDIRPRILKHNPRREFQSNTSSSSDSEAEFLVRRPKKNRRMQYNIGSSDEGNISQNEILSELDNMDELCPICLNRFTVQIVGKPSKCDHCFCLNCIKEWAKTNNTCPVDRKQFNAIRVYNSVNSVSVEEIPVFNVQQTFMHEDYSPPEEINDAISNDNDSDDLDEQESGGDVCCVCDSGSRDYYMLYCDVCYDVYHLQCISPPLRYFPVGPWLCDNCEEISV